MTCQQNGSTVGICVLYSFNTSTNQISNTGYVYGSTGHLINDGTHTYQYDAEGRLISVDNGTTATYLYDALGRRVEKDVGGMYSEYVFNLQGQPVGIHNRTNWQEDYIPLGQGRHVAHYAAGAHFMHPDALGTTGMVTSGVAHL